MAPSLKQLYCARYRIAEGQYERSVFWRCLHFHAYLPAYFLLRSNPARFTADFAMIAEIARISSRAVLKAEIDRFHGINVRDKSLLRGFYKIRLSGKRLIKLQRLLQV